MLSAQRKRCLCNGLRKKPARSGKSRLEFGRMRFPVGRKRVTSSSQIAGRRPFNWRLLMVLLAAILVSSILVAPYALAAVGERLSTPKGLLLLALQCVVTMVIYGILAAIGMIAADRIGLGMPLLESWLAGKPDWRAARRFALPAIITGVLLSVLIVLLEKTLFAASMSAALKQLNRPRTSPPAWEGFLASFYGGITEEILLRLFLLSLVAWGMAALVGQSQARPAPAILWTANIIAAVMFGLGHLPAAAAAGLQMNRSLITRAIVLNGLGGLAFGWFYWTFGLEAAMLCHFSADIVLHVLWPLLGPH